MCTKDTLQTGEGRSSIKYKGIKHRFQEEVFKFAMGSLGASVLFLLAVRITSACRRNCPRSELNEADKNETVKPRR